jgi:peptidoglycan/LPS O-acetylase OafA/YrhL
LELNETPIASRPYAAKAFPMMVLRSNDRDLASLDALRGLAITLVLISHFIPTATAEGHSIAVGFGNAGVILFFFLSGFLMDRTFSREPRIVPYVIKRAMRILPMYWLSIVLIFTIEAGWTMRDVFANLTFTTFAFHVIRMSGVYWTLYIEVLFYALVPVLWFAGARATYLAPYALLVLYGCFWCIGWQLSAAPFYLIYCLLGMQIGLWARDKLGARAALIAMASGIVGSSALPAVSPLLGLAPLLCGALLYVALTYPFRNGILEFFGRISYSLYLLHAIFGTALLFAMLRSGYDPWLAALAAVAFSFALSVVSYLVVERPTIRLGKISAALMARSAV